MCGLGERCGPPWCNHWGECHHRSGKCSHKDIPSNVTAFGNPCRVHKVNEENVNRTGDPKVVEEKLKKIGFVKNQKYYN